MRSEDLLERITVDPKVMVGKPVIRGTRIPVSLILKMLGQGIPTEDVLREYPRLEKVDVEAAIAYAARVVEHIRHRRCKGRAPTIDRKQNVDLSRDDIASPSAVHPSQVVGSENRMVQFESAHMLRRLGEQVALASAETHQRHRQNEACPPGIHW